MYFFFLNQWKRKWGIMGDDHQESSIPLTILNPIFEVIKSEKNSGYHLYEIFSRRNTINDTHELVICQYFEIIFCKFYRKINHREHDVKSLHLTKNWIIFFQIFSSHKLTFLSIKRLIRQNRLFWSVNDESHDLNDNNSQFTLASNRITLWFLSTYHGRYIVYRSKNDTISSLWTT